MKQLLLMWCLIIAAATTSYAQPLLFLDNRSSCSPLEFVMYAEDITCGPGTYISNPILVGPGNSAVFDFSGGTSMPGFWSGTGAPPTAIEFVYAEVYRPGGVPGACMGFPCDMARVDNWTCGTGPINDMVLSAVLPGSGCIACPNPGYTLVQLQFNSPAVVIPGVAWTVVAQ